MTTDTQRFGIQLGGDHGDIASIESTHNVIDIFPYARDERLKNPNAGIDKNGYDASTIDSGVAIAIIIGALYFYRKK